MQGERFKVSIVVAAYNEERYIGHTLESILSQKVDFDYEILVGDDCSNDKTADVIRKYAKKYSNINPIIREMNMGMTENSMDLIARAQGEYLALIEGDDYWIDEHKLQKQVDFLDSNSDYLACFGQCIIVDENDVRHPEIEPDCGFIRHSGDYTLGDFENYLLPGQTATSLYRTDEFNRLYKKIMETDFDLHHFIDRHMVLLMLSGGKLYNSGEEYAAYRKIMKKESGSWSSKNDLYNFRNIMNYLEGLKELEVMGKNLKMEVNFDERRKYEIRKLASRLSEFSKSEAKELRKAMVKYSNNRFDMAFYQTKYFLKKDIKRAVKRLLKLNGDKL